MNSFKFRRSVFTLSIIFVISAAVIFFLMGLTYKHIEKLSENNQLMNHSMEISIEIENLYTDLKDIESERRNYILTQNIESKNLIIQSQKEVNSDVIILRKSLADNPQQSKKLLEIEKLIDKKFDIVNYTLQEKNVSIDNEKIKASLISGRNVMAEIGVKVKEMIKTESGLHTKRKNAFSFARKSTPVYSYILALFSLGLLGYAFFRIYDEVKKQKEINTELELALKTSKLAESIGNYGVWIYDFKTGNYTFSDNQYKILGYEPKSFKAGKGVFVKHAVQKDAEIVEKEFLKKNTQDYLPPFSFRILRKDGKERILEITAKKIWIETEEPLLLGITTDITENIRNKEKLEQINRDLEANNKELESFNYIASHDLQEPLRKIETFISRLDAKDSANFSDAGKQYFERMKVAAKRMRKLIDDLLHFSRTSRHEYVFEETDLNILMENVMEELQQKIDDKNAKIVVGNLPKSQVIPFQIQQVFSNLISNSLKYCQENVKPEILVSAKKIDAKDEAKLRNKNISGSFYQFIFDDNGIGFEKEYEEKIFDLFTRLHGKTEYEGTGIGLAICKKIMENHNGFIFAESELNKGTTFTFYLPV